MREGLRNDRIMTRADVMRRYVYPTGTPGMSTTEAQVEARILADLASRGIVPHSNGTRVVFVNDSAWCVVCDCGPGLACTPGLDTVLCPFCGARYDLIWPDDESIKRIEATLLERQPYLPMELRSKVKLVPRCWDPGQTVEQLEKETKQFNAAVVAARRATK